MGFPWMWDKVMILCGEISYYLGFFAMMWSVYGFGALIQCFDWEA